MKTRESGSRIFLTELMFSILMFIVVAAVCVQAFGSSVYLSKKADNLTHAVNMANNAAEEFLAEDNFDSFTAYYDKDWQEVDADGTYKMTGIVVDQKGKYSALKKMSITVTSLKDETEIYSLDVEKGKPLED